MFRPTKIQQARRLRRSQTETEQKLWAVLKNRQLQKYKFRRQHPVGPFIADFACIEHYLIVEIDGSQHVDNFKDDERTAKLETWGWRVLRFWNLDIIKNIQGVQETILNALSRPLTLPSPPRGGEGFQTSPFQREG